MSVIDRAKRFLWKRQYNYQATFNSPPGQEVLADLAIFCRAGESTFHEDARAHAMAEGRREVWLRLSHHLNLTESQLWGYYDGRTDAT